MRDRLVSISMTYREAQPARSLAQLGLTLALLLASYMAGMAVSQRSISAGMLFAIASSAFVVRLFIIQHDCGHRSFFRSHQANDLLGFWLGIVTMTPYRCWRRFHALHHANSGNLDHRGIGDIYTLTTQEYEGLPLLRQWLYRLYRHPLILFVIGPPFLFILRQRTTFKIPLEWKIERRNVHTTNLCILGLGALLCGIYDPFVVLSFHLAVMSLSAIAGVWLFYVQHQFPNAYWKQRSEWEFWRASMEGASYYELPTMLRWLTANIGLHHIHHLDARIPNYRLYECFLNHPEFATSRRFGLRESFKCMNLRLWDTQAQRMVPFPSTSRHRQMENAT
ncbi:fatty acid desaturase [Thiobacillus sp. 0-1251]|uniref:fatty acid desaturase n=1 Tax=Thiobacillus sp. 0-1251 TaxID=1895858 RepID=UPI000B2C80EB|nr:fatty acid desaturase [Thiobacillus sp. 0-1251]